jgi:hypothetical protein
LLEAQHPAGDVLLVKVVFPNTRLGSDATRLDTTILVFTGSRNAPRSNIKTCSIVQD